jgi:large subunit ribosomal protein L14
MVIISVKKGVADMRRQLLKAVIVRQKRPFRRSDGTMVQFEDNAAVIVTDTGETKGSMIKGPVALEAAERYPKIASNASIIV